MNKQTVEGKFDQVVGKVKEKVGDATGNQNLANSGVADQVKGAAKETWGNTKDAARDIADQNRAEAHRTADETRHNVSDSVQHAKDVVKEKSTKSATRNVVQHKPFGHSLEVKASRQTGGFFF